MKTIETLLTPSKIVKDIIKAKESWNDESDWWFGSSQKFINAKNGYDVNVCEVEGEPGDYRAHVYDLDDTGDGPLQTTDNVIMSFGLGNIEDETIPRLLAEIESDENKKARVYLDVMYNYLFVGHLPYEEFLIEGIEYNAFVSRARGSDNINIEVRSNDEPGKKMFTVTVDRSGNVLSSYNIDLKTDIEAVSLSRETGSSYVSPSSGANGMIFYSKEDREVKISIPGRSSCSLGDKTRPWVKHPLYKTDGFELMAAYPAKYYNGKLVQIVGQDRVVGVGDRLINEDSGDFVVAVYRIGRKNGY